MQLIYINGGIFLAMMVIRLLLFLTGNDGWYHLFTGYLAVPASPLKLLFRPWTVFTHMFVHDGLWHVLINMIWLYFGGNIFLNFLDSKKLLSTYVLGALSGALIFVISFNLIPRFAEVAEHATAVGASAATLSILVAAATTVPNYVVRLVLIGPIKLKYIALVLVLIDFIFIPDGNAGGHFGHLGGALFGFIYASQLKQGRDLTVDFLKPIYWIKNGIPKRQSKIKVVHRKRKSDYDYNAEKKNRQEQVDAILDKIKRSGYESLSKSEKEILFQASKEI